MQPSPAPRQARIARFALVSGALLLLLGVVAFASKSGFGHADQSQPTPGYVSWAMSIFIVVFVLMIPVAIYAYALQTREYRAKKDDQSQAARVLRRFAIVIALLVVLLTRIYFGKRLHVSFIHPQVHRPPGDAKVLGKPPKPYEPTFQWPVLYATVALGAIAVALFLFLRKTGVYGQPPEGAEPTFAEDVAATITDAIDDLEAEPDARRAVIAAYARMEAAFARHGLTRAPSETAVEFLRRILVGLGSRTDPVARLTGLFEQAKFSGHEIDATMKDDAIDALRSIRADLAGAAA
jgi:hypothetical protein